MAASVPFKLFLGEAMRAGFFCGTGPEDVIESGPLIYIPLIFFKWVERYYTFMLIIDGKKIAGEIQQEIAEKIKGISGRKPCLAVVAVGHHPASAIYIKRKIAACEEVGIRSIRMQLSQEISEAELHATIEKLNQDNEVDGILVQLPLPSHMNPLLINEKILSSKDVDGFHPINMGKLLMGEKGGFVPCTPLGIKTLLQRSQIEVSGKHVVIVGRSLIVGKPLAALLMQSSEGSNATVTVLHSRSENIPALCLTADILIVAIGQPGFITKEMVKKGAVVIDVGINRISDNTGSYRIVGDVDFENVKAQCSAITPVPGGVGPMTIAMLLLNTLESSKKN